MSEINSANIRYYQNNILKQNSFYINGYYLEYSITKQIPKFVRYQRYCLKTICQSLNCAHSLSYQKKGDVTICDISNRYPKCNLSRDSWNKAWRYCELNQPVCSCHY